MNRYIHRMFLFTNFQIFCVEILSTLPTLTDSSAVAVELCCLRTNVNILKSKLLKQTILFRSTITFRCVNLGILRLNVVCTFLSFYWVIAYLDERCETIFFWKNKIDFDIVYITNASYKKRWKSNISEENKTLPKPNKHHSPFYWLFP